MSKSKFIQEYFNFSKREQNGIIVLCCILLIVIGIKVFMAVRDDDTKVRFEALETDIDDFVAYQTPNFDSVDFFTFDPNTVSREELLQLGLSLKSINGIMQFRDKGWRFYRADDLLKIDGFSDEEFAAVKDYVDIPSKRTNYGNFDNYPRYERRRYDRHERDLQPFDFDPNTATQAELEALGLRSWQAENIIKYRNKGGIFRQPNDLKKIYSLPDDVADKLIPYVKIASNASGDSTSTATHTAYTDIIVELNSANEQQLEQLRGIGPSFANRIIKYRTMLGGYVSVNQVVEVYGFTQEMFDNIKSQLQVDASKVKKLNVNTATFKQLVTHPYIDKTEANAILNYRKFVKKIQTLDEMVKQKAVSREFIEKLTPYLTVE